MKMEENIQDKKTYTQMRAEFYKMFKRQICPELEEFVNSHKVKKIALEDIFLSLFFSLLLTLLAFVGIFKNSNSEFYSNAESPLGGMFEFAQHLLTLVHPTIAILIFLIFFSVFIVSFYFSVDNINRKTSLLIKDRVMGKITSIIGGIEWNSLNNIDNNEASGLGVFNYFSKNTSDDYFNGIYNDVQFEIFNPKFVNFYKAQQIIIFEGVIIKIKLNKKFTSHTICYKNMLLNEIHPPYLHKTEFEDSKFEKKFDVWTNDDIEARYLITTAFIDRLVNLEKRFFANNIECVFKEGFLYVIFKKKNAFDVCNINKPLADFAQFNELFEQILAIRKLIDILRLEQKIGM